MIVNLTPARSHEEIARRAFEAGKHVNTEKTITDSFASARALCELADRNRLYLGSAPDTFLGSSLQSARRAVDWGILGTSPDSRPPSTATTMFFSVCSRSAVFRARGSAWTSAFTMLPRLSACWARFLRRPLLSAPRIRDTEISSRAVRNTGNGSIFRTRVKCPRYFA